MPWAFLSHDCTCGAAAWWIARDDARESQATEVEAKLVVIVLANQFRMHLRDTVDRSRPLYLQNETNIGWDEKRFPLLLTQFEGPTWFISLCTRVRGVIRTTYCYVNHNNCQFKWHSIFLLTSHTHSDIGRWISRTIWSEGSDCAGHKDA